MKDRILDCLGILGVAAFWTAFICSVFYFASCNSSKHIQKHTESFDSTAIHHTDSSGSSTSRTEERQGNERVMEMLFGMQQAIDAKGQPIINTYPTSLKVIERSGSEKITLLHDTVHLEKTDSSHKGAAATDDDKKSSTHFFEWWWLVAALVFGFVTRYIKISKR